MGSSASRVSEAPAADLSDADLDRILRAANPIVLRAALVHLTGSPELAAVPTIDRPTRGGSSWETVLDPDRVDELIAFAAEYLRRPIVDVPDPDHEVISGLLPLLAGAEPSDDERAMYLEELGFDEFSRDVSWPGGAAPAHVDEYHVTVIGAGVSGIAAGVLLKRLGIPFTILERGDGIGGVWETNTYPEARVDVHSLLYQYKYVKDHRWTEWFADRNAVHAYHNAVVDRFGLRPHVQLRTTLLAATWDEAAAAWRIRVEGPNGVEERVTSFVVSASGLFSRTSLPNIPGIEAFEGPLFHTTTWEHGYDFAGKAVALIGNGATGTQLMPEIARRARSLTVFQRSPNWIVENPLYRSAVPDEILWLYDNLPGYWNWNCLATYVVAARNQWANVVDPEWIAAGGTVSERNDQLRAFLTDQLRDRFPDRPDLFERLLPSYAPGAKRIIVHNGWYDALQEPHVELVTDGIERFTATGIRTVDGREFPLDAVILASGFAVSEYFWPVEYRGRDGASLEQRWAKDGARAYLGMAIPGFPNFFSMYGPNSQPRAGGFHQFAESWARYIVSAIAEVIAGHHRSIQCRPEAYDRYNELLDDEFSRTIWTTGAGGYYINEHGRPGVHVPFANEQFYSMIRHVEFDDYEIR